jgi:mono/diheme cytochrome c family protein
MLKSFLLLASVMLLGVAGAPSSSPSAGGPAQEPAAAPAAPAAPSPSSTVKNPVKATAESQAKAKKTYGYDCAMCHGATGDGKTDLVKDMQLPITDLTDPKTLADKSDGDIFDIIRKGKDKMPAEDPSRAKDDDVWNLVIYVRGLAKSNAAVHQ